MAGRIKYQTLPEVFWMGEENHFTAQRYRGRIRAFQGSAPSAEEVRIRASKAESPL